MRTHLVLVAATLASASSAHALNQSKHFDVTVQSCRAAGLPSAFCARVGAEVYNVDAREFNDLSAHSQVQEGATACDSANASLWRVFWLGGQIRAATVSAGYSPSRAGHDLIANRIGRALHTIQDNCAHSGMPNPQHAWHSLSDTCQGTHESPDIVPAAFTCARAETDAIFAGFIDVLHDNGGDFSQLRDVSTDIDKHWPPYGDVCDFLGSADQWDGQDRRWDNTVVRPALRSQLLAGLSGAPDSQFTRVCGGWDDVQLAWTDPDRDTSDGPQSCIKIHAFCLGKADGAAEQAPPYETPGTEADQPPVAEMGAAGCSVGGESKSSTAALALLWMGALLALGVRKKDSRQ